MATLNVYPSTNYFSPSTEAELKDIFTNDPASEYYIAQPSTSKSTASSDTFRPFRPFENNETPMPIPTECPSNIRKRPLESDRAIQFLFDIPRDESGKQLPESDGLLKCEMLYLPWVYFSYKNLHSLRLDSIRWE